VTPVRHRWAAGLTLAATAAIAIAALTVTPRLFGTDASAAVGTRRIGLLCRIAEGDGAEASASLRALCRKAAGLLARPAADDFGADGPVIVIALEPQPSWAGGARPRILLRAMSAWSGWRLPVIGSPTLVIDPREPGWRERADDALGRMIRSLATDG